MTQSGYWASGQNSKPMPTLVENRIPYKGLKVSRWWRYGKLKSQAWNSLREEDVFNQRTLFAKPI